MDARKVVGGALLATPAVVISVVLVVIGGWLGVAAVLGGVVLALMTIIGIELLVD